MKKGILSRYLLTISDNEIKYHHNHRWFVWARSLLNKKEAFLSQKKLSLIIQSYYQKPSKKAINKPGFFSSSIMWLTFFSHWTYICWCFLCQMANWKKRTVLNQQESVFFNREKSTNICQIINWKTSET